jgi:type IV pilus assembly protein PilV
MIEVLVSMLLFSVGVLGLVRVLAIAVRDAGEVEYRAIAATVADETIGRMWLDRADLASYAAVDAEVPELPGGTQTIAVDGNVVTVTVNWLPPGAADARVHAVAATLTGN